MANHIGSNNNWHPATFIANIADFPLIATKPSSAIAAMSEPAAKNRVRRQYAAMVSDQYAEFVKLVFAKFAKNLVFLPTTKN